MNRLPKWFRQASRASCPSSRIRSARPGVEQLEDRQLLSVTLGNLYAPVLSHVEVDTIFYGNAWYTNQGLRNQADQLNAFFNSITHSTYMDMLSEYSTPLYAIGRGTVERTFFVTDQLPGMVSDRQIQNMVDIVVNRNWLPAPDGERLYVVFTAPGVRVQADNGDTSPNVFLGYHSTFRDAGFYSPAYYAVVTYGAGQGIWPGLTGFQTMTKVASHELSEAVTDPDTRTGWRDYAVTGDEIGDIANNVLGVLNGYVVQAEYLNSLNANCLPYDAEFITNGDGNFLPGWGYSRAPSAQLPDQPLQMSQAGPGLSAADRSIAINWLFQDKARGDGTSAGGSQVSTELKCVSKDQAGLVDLVFGSGDVFENPLTGSAPTAGAVLTTS